MFHDMFAKRYYDLFWNFDYLKTQNSMVIEFVISGKLRGQFHFNEYMLEGDLEIQNIYSKMKMYTKKIRNILLRNLKMLHRFLNK